MNTIETTSGNTPVQHIPSDYYPEGSARWFVIPEGPDQGKKMFFYDIIHGKGEPEETLLFVHGNPESSYTYRKVICILREKSEKTLRIVAMDHIGFGLSDQAGFEMVDMHHADNLIQLVRHLDLNAITLIVHDWGGPIGIGALLKDHYRVKNLVMLNTTVFPIPPDGMTYENYPISWLSWSFFPKIIPNRFWGWHAAFSVFTPPRNPLSLIFNYIIYYTRVMFNQTPEKDGDAHRLFREQFKTRINARSSKRIVRQTPVWGHGYEYDDAMMGHISNRDFYKTLQETITRHWGPKGKNIGVKAVLGAWDPLAKQSVIAQWVKALPQLTGHIQVFNGVSHFVEEARPQEICEAILSLMN